MWENLHTALVILRLQKIPAPEKPHIIAPTAETCSELHMDRNMPMYWPQQQDIIA